MTSQLKLYIAGLFVLVLVVYWRFNRGPCPLPPSPPADPIIGHFRILPRSHQSDVYYEWSKKYGDVFYLNVLGRSIVVLNSVQAANELLDKRGVIYSDRPPFPLFEKMGWIGTLTFLKYGPQFHKQRRVLQNYLSKQNCELFRPVHTEEARRLLHRLLVKPKEFDWNVRMFGAAIVMKISYGHQVESDEDEFIKLTEHVSVAHAAAGDPGSTPVDFFPILRHLPWWFPGAWFNRHAHNWRWAIRRFHDYPFEQVRKGLAAGTAQNCFSAEKIEEITAEGYDGDYTMEDAKAAAGVIYAGGAETTWSTLVIFIFAMVLYPEAQKKAQKEIDDVIGSDRLPEFSDRPNLPYVEALIHEVTRWQPVTPLIVPHVCMEDDIYNGMWIPKGSLVFANARAMTLDERTYKNPHMFYPERFLPKPEGLGEEPSGSHWGFGRRACPGRFLAEGSIYMAATSILATFNIKKPIGPDGKERTPEVAFTSGLSSHPKHFDCDIQPRSEKAKALIDRYQF